MERQAALRTAQTSSSQDTNQDDGVTVETMRNLQQVRGESEPPPVEEQEV